jgi:diguanylate cyclase
VVPVGAGLAMVLFPIGYSGQSRARFVLDGFIVVGALFEISWVLVLQSVYNKGGTSGFALGLSLTYPIADIAILTIAVLVKFDGLKATSLQAPVVARSS